VNTLEFTLVHDDIDHFDTPERSASEALGHAVVPARFNGPPDCGNGGYVCGLLAGYLQGPARVRLSSPVPVETELDVLPADNDGRELRLGDELIATAWPDRVHVIEPDAPTIDEARTASMRYVGFREHAIPGCYVCGPERSVQDGMRLFAGRVGNSKTYACVWTPASDQLDEDGFVRPEFVWAALDCPGYFAAFGDHPRPALLGELAADLRSPMPGDSEYAVYAWCIDDSGRKRWAGTAIADAKGRVLAVAKATWIELKA
jgi:hypothetical protein